jgi:hypothetical protein
MMIYRTVFGYPSVQSGQRVGDSNLNIYRQVGDFIPHNRTFVPSRHLCSLCRRRGVVKEVVVREQIIEKTRIAAALRSQHQHVV